MSVMSRRGNGTGNGPPADCRPDLGKRPAPARPRRGWATLKPPETPRRTSTRRSAARRLAPTRDGTARRCRQRPTARKTDRWQDQVIVSGMSNRAGPTAAKVTLPLHPLLDDIGLEWPLPQLHAHERVTGPLLELPDGIDRRDPLGLRGADELGIHPSARHPTRVARSVGPRCPGADPRQPFR